MEKINLNYNNIDFQEILSFIKNSSLGKQINSEFRRQGR